MTNNQNEGQPAPPLASQERITSEELAQAMSRIEARREAEAQRLAGTIPVGQAVEELDLAVTPEELLAEVKALRQQSKPAPRPAPPSPSSPVEALPRAAAESTSQQDDVSLITHCPACSRKLLTQASALCNWCGAKINDPQYQERAARSRQNLDQTELSQLETLVQEEARYGVFGRLKRRAKQNPGNKNPLG